MDKKAQGLSLDVIIIAAIVLIVLVVLVAVFLGSPVTTLGDEVSKVAPQDLIRAQTQSTSRCKPSKAGLESELRVVGDVTEAEYQQQYDAAVRRAIDYCTRRISSTESILTNKQTCNDDSRCTYI